MIIEPGVDFKTEMDTSGLVYSVPVGEMQMRLLQKIEELTLHMIALEKENGQLKTRVLALEAEKN